MNETFRKIHSLVKNCDSTVPEKIKTSLETYNKFKVENIAKRVFVIKVKNDE